ESPKTEAAKPESKPAADKPAASPVKRPGARAKIKPKAARKTRPRGAMSHAPRPGIDSVALRRLVERENETFVASHRESARLATESAAHWLDGVPMHWMRDWNTPHP